MILDEFDNEITSVINPSESIKKCIKNFPSTAVAFYSKALMEKFIDLYHPKKIAELEEKYRNQINNQKVALDEEYNKKLSQIDTEVRATVTEKAKNLNYNLVLPKNIVFYGGEDITDVIAKEIK